MIDSHKQVVHNICKSDQFAGEAGQCPPVKVNHRGASGGSGAGGSVVIFTKELVGSVSGNIYVQGGVPPSASVCGAGSGSGIKHIKLYFYSVMN